MKRPYLFLLLILLAPCTLLSQSAPAFFFRHAYDTYPQLPRGILEAVAWHNTRMTHLTGDEPESCTGMPRYYTIMGLVENGKGYFRENLPEISAMTGTPAEMIKSDAGQAILAYAGRIAMMYEATPQQSYIIEGVDPGLSKIIHVATQCSELPYDPANPDAGQYFSRLSFQYALIQFLNDHTMQDRFDFPDYHIDMAAFFGDYLRFLQSSVITIQPQTGRVENEEGDILSPESDNPESADYGPALWNPAPTCNYGSRNGTPVSAVTIHTVQGSYAGCISWFQNCNASVSAHYVLRSSDGQVTQMVLESNRAYHVGSENPYTIGLEHEGYVNNPAWYTTAMYNSSAALVSDICNSGYGINPIRTAWWPWAASTYYNQSGIPGSCTRIKGHQHYPNQTHTDPGVNWDWNRYYTLIHPAPAPQLYTTATGSLQDPGGNSNYPNDNRTIYTISPVNATSVSISFSSFQLENLWDYLYIYDGPDIHSPLTGYYTGNNSPGTVVSSGGSITLEFRSDCATTAPGFDLTWNSSNQPPPGSDHIPPVTMISSAPGWKTQDFSVFFTDTDSGGSGLEKTYYQVIDHNGTEWRANAMRGFFNDNFDLGNLHPEWTAHTGAWNTTGGYLGQTDENNGNTNIAAAVRQNLSNRYLYHFAMQISGSGTNRRAGLHYFADSASLPNRGNGYFVWFRVDDAKLQFYKVANDVYTLVSEENLVTQPGQWYDYKIFYDRITGKTEVFRDNVYVASWTDNAPYASGKYISLRTGNASVQVNDMKVYRSRPDNQSLPVSVGNCNSCDIRYQSANPSSPAGRIKSIAADSAGNLSGIAYEDIYVDWTPPSVVSIVNDGDSSDIDILTSLTHLSGNWSTSADTHSAIARYWYAVGTTPGDSNVVQWTDNWFQIQFLDTLSLSYDTWYYISVRPENGAGLTGNISTSDGAIMYALTTETFMKDQLQLTPNPTHDQVYISLPVHHGEGSIRVYDEHGKLIREAYISAETHTHQISLAELSVSSGIYFVQFTARNNDVRYAGKVIYTH